MERTLISEPIVVAHVLDKLAIAVEYDRPVVFQSGYPYSAQERECADDELAVMAYEKIPRIGAGCLEIAATWRPMDPKDGPPSIHEVRHVSGSGEFSTFLAAFWTLEDAARFAAMVSALRGGEWEVHVEVRRY